jgi:hypothetical protein
MINKCWTVPLLYIAMVGISTAAATSPDHPACSVFNPEACNLRPRFEREANFGSASVLTHHDWGSNGITTLECYDYRTYYADSPSVLEQTRYTLQLDLEAEVGLVCYVRSESGPIFFEPTILHYQVGEEVHGLYPDDYQEVVGELGVIREDYTAIVLLMFPYASLNETFSLNFRGDSVDITLPAN